MDLNEIAHTKYTKDMAEILQSLSYKVCSIFLSKIDDSAKRGGKPASVYFLVILCHLTLLSLNILSQKS